MDNLVMTHLMKLMIGGFEFKRVRKEVLKFPLYFETFIKYIYFQVLLMERFLAISKLKKFDFFGSKVEFNFNGNSRSASFCGVSVTFICIGIILSSIYISGNDIVLKKNPKVVTSSVFFQDPEPMIISPETFPFAFGLETPDEVIHYQDETIYNVKVSHVKSVKVQQNGTTIEVKNTTNVDIEPCTPSHFGDLYSKFDNLLLTKLYCLNHTNLQSLHIQGLFESPHYETITISIEKCVNGTSNVVCAPPNIMDSMLSGGWFAIYYPNLRMDLKNFTSPAVRSRDSYFTSVSSKYGKTAQIWLQHVELITDTGIMFETLNTERFIQMDHVRELSIYKDNPVEIMSLDIRVEKVKNDYKRSYVKLQDIFASVDGTATLLILITVWLIKPYATWKFYEGLINEVFDIQLDDDNDEDDKKGKKEKKEKKINSQPSIGGKVQEPNNSQDPGKNNLQVPAGDVLYSSNAPLMRSELKNNNILNKSDLSDLPVSPVGYKKQTTNLSKFSRPSTIKAHEYDMKDTEILPKFAFTDENIALPSNSKNEHIRISYLKLPKLAATEENILLSGNRRETRINQIKSIQARSLDLEQTIDNNQDVQTEDMHDAKDAISRMRADNKPVKPTLKVVENNEEDLEALAFSIKNDEERKDDDEKKVTTRGPEEQVQSERVQTLTEQPLKMQIIRNGEENNALCGENHGVLESNEERKNMEEQIMTRLEIEVSNNVGPKQKPVQINISFFEFLMSFLWMPKELRKKMKILEKGISKMEKKLDIFNVLKSLREIEKLKILLFEGEQFVLFDNLPKPTLRLNDQPKYRVSSSHSLLKKGTIGNFPNRGAAEAMLLTSYKKLKTKFEVDASVSMIDKKLVGIYGEILNEKP